MLKKIFSLLLCAMTAMLCTFAVSAAELKAGDTAYVTYGGTVLVTKTASYSGGIGEVNKGSRVTVLDPYIIGEDNRKFHKIQLQNGDVGYILAYTTARETTPILEAAETAEKELNKQWETSDPDKYQHAINMTFLSDYIYGGSKTTEGEEMNFYAKVPTEWVRHKRPASLPLVGKAILHIGDAGKIGSVKVSFYPGEPPINYHIRRLDELREIGYEPIFSEKTRIAAYANTAFYATVFSEFDVVAYNEDWVAIWSDGGVDESRGSVRQCGEKDGTAFNSWKPGVYFAPRKNCYILDINNQVTTPPQIEAVGKVTANLLVKTTPDETDYVKSGVYKINQSVQIVDAAPQNGHYKIYYKHGLYYVNSKYVNIQYTNIQKPNIAYKAEAVADSDVSDGVSVVGSVKKGTAIDVIQKNYDGTNAIIWFNSKECYIPTSNLGNFVEAPSAANVAQLGAPIGVIAVDSPWSAYGVSTYTAAGLALLKESNYESPYDEQTYAKLEQAYKTQDIMHEGEWANVYKIEDYSYYDDPSFPDYLETGKIYTIYYDGDVRYIMQNNEQRQTFNYYPGSGFSKTSVANTQPVCIDGYKYNAVAYNIDGNNYFKLRDIAKMLNGTVKTFDIKYDASTNSIDMLSFFDYTSVGGELTPGDGVTRNAVSSSAFLTLDGIPIQATCYNIDGNNYFKLRDVTDALDCRVEWEDKTRTIWVVPGMSAYDDPDIPVG